MPVKKKVYRLFRVAKELNVGTALLVDHLQDKGHDVESSPNTKLSSDQYDLLLKAFASEKMMKEKADELSEKRKEETKITTAKPDTPAPPPTTEEDKVEDITAADLRSSIRRRKPATKEAIADPLKPVRQEAPAEPEPPKVKEPVEVEAVPVPETENGGLKVLGKIDLNKVGGRTRDKKPTAKRQEKPAKKPAVSPPPVAKKVDTPKPPVTPPKPESKTPPPPKPPKEAPPIKKPPKIEKKNIEKTAPPIQEKQQPPKVKTPPPPPAAKKPQVQKPEPPAAEEPPAVVRAEDHTPKLSGLKVMGKIELPGDRKKKKKEAEKPSTPEAKKTSTTGDGDGDSSKKRRRRRRKRKKTGDTPNTSSNQRNSGNSGGGRKEKPSEKEVDKSIKNTLSQMGNRPSRTRQRLRRAKRDADAARREALEAQAAEEAMVLELTEFITVNEFANLINVPAIQIITKSFELGIMVSINQRLDAELLTLLAGDYGYEVNFVDVTENEIEIEEEEDAVEDLKPRAPIITVMGHVDHGKTTLLDHLRNANVVAGEAGGITQHIGAYTVNLEDGRKVTFLDTPGHEAFTAMRARGAKVTDVAIIVIAADDAIMPQTREAINHAQAAEVNMVFALNKIDKAGANPEKIKTQLAEMDLLVEDWGGKYQSQEISALKGQGVEDLLEKVLFEADLLELKANPDRTAMGTVIEARLDRGRGNVATVLVEKGTLRVGDALVAGIHSGRVRAIINQNGQRIKEAGPSTPVQILGLNGQPTAGDKFYVFEDESKAKDISQRRTELFREQQFRNTNRLTLEEIGRRRALGNFKELNVLIRGDVDGSVEALAGSLLKLSTEEVQVNIIQKAVGAIPEADINLAIASEAIVIAFNVRPNAQARNLAEREDVDIRTYSVIYDAINDIKDALEGLLSPEIREEMAGTAEVKEVFKVSKVGMVAGCLVTSGKIERNNPVRVIRDSVVIYESKLSSLKRFKDDAKEVISGQECGIMVENYNDVRVGDVIESYRVNEIRRKL